MSRNALSEELRHAAKLEVAVKIVGWSDFKAGFSPPPHVFKENGTVVEFNDYPHYYGLAVGDLIQYEMAVGTWNFRVVDVFKSNVPNYPSEMLTVTATRIET